MATLNFLSDFQELIGYELSNLGHASQPDEDLDTVLIRYLNLLRRLPPVVPWTVKQSTDVANKSLPKEIRDGLKQFIKKAESGEDLKPYLSTQINDPDYADLMFYDGGIFHFHLGTTPHLKHKGFIKRTGELLFAITEQSTATMYLIDTHPHKGGFTNQALLRIIEKNWSEILEPYTVYGVSGLSYHASDDDIGTFREAQINAMIQTPSGRCLVPMGGGITLAGTSAQNRIEANRVIGTIRQLEKQIIQNREALESYFKTKYRKDWDELKFKLTSFELVVRVEEVITGEVVFKQGQQGHLLDRLSKLI